MEKTRNKALVVFLLFFLFLAQLCKAQESTDNLDLLKQDIKQGKTVEEVQSQLKELADLYTRENKFDEFYDFLATLEKDKKFVSSPLIYYYEALTRFNQMEFLEENKRWEEFFDNKDLYESQINTDLENAKKLIAAADDLSLRLKFLEWQLIKDEAGVSINVLEDLFNLAQDYSKEQSDVQVIKEIADKLSKREEINYAKKLYSVYVTKISETEIGYNELKTLAEDFLKENRVDLATSLFEAYLDKLISTQKDEDTIIREMFIIAKRFAHSGWEYGLDPFYAEQIYEKIEFLYEKEAFSDLLQYNRAYNLERSKEFEPCLNEYSKLVNNYPEYQDRDRIYFRLGVISAYIFQEIEKAREYFLKVVKNYPDSLDYLNSLYHLGILSQVQDDSEKAMEYYLQIQEVTNDLRIKPDLAEMAESRIKEIAEEQEMDYNLKIFLDTVLEKKEDKKYIHLELYAKAAKDYLDKTIKFQTNSYYLETGCLQQDFTYLWSGQLGNNQNPFNQFEFETSYSDLGTKVVNVVLVGPSGAVDGTIEMADIYKESNKLN